MLDGPFQSPLISESVGASLLKSQALRSNPRGFSRSGGELQSDTGSRSRMDSTAQHYFEAARKADVQRGEPPTRTLGIAKPSGRQGDGTTRPTRELPYSRISARPSNLPNPGTTVPRSTNRRNHAHPWPSGPGPSALQVLVSKPHQQQGSTALPTGSRTGKRA